MSRVGKRVGVALAISSLSSLAYLGLALYQLFAIAVQDKRMFLLLVIFTVEVLFWCIYLFSLFCSANPSPNWHLRRLTLPLWDLVFVLGMSMTGLQLRETNGASWWEIDAQTLYGQVIIIGVLAALPLKLVSAVVLSEYYHRSHVRDDGPTYARAYDGTEMAALSPTAPPEDNTCY